MNEIAIDLKNVSADYENVRAIDNISLQVKKGEFLGIIGPNGGGKSTLLKVILGLHKPVKGTVKVLGKNIYKSEEKPIIGYVPQASTFDRKFPISVMDVILMARLGNGFSLFKKYKTEDKEIAINILEELELIDFRKRQIGQLSGGQLQRVLIARALAVQPELILLDEPTASVDSSSRSSIFEILKQLNEKITIVVVTHDLEAVSSYFKSLACMNFSLHYHGNPELTQNTIDKTYGCPVDLIAHGIPHRILKSHETNNKRGRKSA
ncbi:MAG: zinc transport system ATP-binding protein [Kosmotogales bacterium]|nr:zinc transport system ATP-binding protein [Kosmotogales bacterium]